MNDVIIAQKLTKISKWILCREREKKLRSNGSSNSNSNNKNLQNFKYSNTRTDMRSRNHQRWFRIYYVTTYVVECVDQTNRSYGSIFQPITRMICLKICNRLECTRTWSLPYRQYRQYKNASNWNDLLHILMAGGNGYFLGCVENSVFISV